MIIHMIGNAHIDPVWLWPWQAGADEAYATMASAADRCDEYPDFIFSRGESWIYEQVERLHPDLFSRIQELVANGQWHITGGQFLQPDLNLPTAAGLHRQIIHGQKYFRDRFNVSPKIGFNVDSFGHTASLPDILVEHGYTGYIFGRPGPHQLDLPANTFIWSGTDGGEVIAFRINPTYVANSTELSGQIKIAIESADENLGHTMCFFGVGNHGGGPTKAMIEWIRKNRNSFDGHELVFSTPERFFEAILGKRELLPVVEFELQKTFPGCYSVMHDIKMAQRQNENLLVQAENAISAFSNDKTEFKRSASRLDKLWNDLLFTEFHDILAGTSISSSWSSVRAMQGRAQIGAENIIYDLTRKWSKRQLKRANEQQIVVINTDVADRVTWVEAEPNLDFGLWGSRWIKDEDGNAIPFQEIQPDSQLHVSRILFKAGICALGGASFQVCDENDHSAGPGEKSGRLSVTNNTLSNEFLDVELHSGGIRQISYKGTKLLGPNGLGLHLRQDSTDTWTFHKDRFDEAIACRFSGTSWIIEEKGPLRVKARLEGRVGNSRVLMTVSLYSGDPSLKVEYSLNFDERYKILQVPIDLGAEPIGWKDGIAQSGITRVPSPTEVPFLGWSRLKLSENDIGLITDSFYSHSVNNGMWQLTFLRSPRMAWGGGQPKVYAGRNIHTDQGVHNFDFTLVFDKDINQLTMEQLHRQAAQPLIVFDRYEGMNRPVWGAVPPREIWDRAMFRNVEDGLIEDVKLEE